jgi:anti-sigma regulatory factor (Ser/Thr protein kinase)
MSDTLSPRREVLRLELPRDTYYLASIRYVVRAAALHAGFDDGEAHQIQTAVDEACAVAISDAAARASGEHRALRAERASISVELRQDRRKLSVTVCNEAGERGFEDSFQEGAGSLTDTAFLLISQFMDEVEYSEGERGPEITLTKWRHRRPEA